MRDTSFLFWADPPPPGMADLAHFAHLTEVGKSPGHQLLLLVTKVSKIS